MNFKGLRTLQPIEWLLAVLLIIAPLYFHPNVGGTGLRIPNNILIWIVGSGIGFYSLYTFVSKPLIHLPRYFLLLLSFPLIAFFSGSLSGVEIASQWAFRVLFIWAGVLFFFGLFQHQLKQGRLDRLLFFVIIACFVHALVGLSQIIWLKSLPVWLPVNPIGHPTGLFQQINNQASYQVTGIIAALWLVSRPFISKGPQWRFFLLLTMIICSSFIVSYSGSRVGALGFILSLPLILISRWPMIKKDRVRWGMIAMALIISISSAGIFENNRGLSSALDKATAMNAGFSGSARLGMYAIAADVIKDAPLLGHGIGSFVRVWQLGKPAFYAEHPDATLPGQRVAHPHNEVIFWLVEGGIITGIGLLLVLVAIFLTLKRLPPSRRYAYAALLIPIALHTQVELPFYISAGHWFLFLLLLFIIMQPSKCQYRIVLSTAAITLIKVISIVGGLTAVGFLSHTMAANLEFKRYITKQVPRGESPFPIAMENPYFKTLATHTLMTNLFHSSVRYKLDDNVRLFAEWGANELKYNPHISFYILTIRARIYLGENDSACTLAREAGAIYPNHLVMKEVLNQCDKLNGILERPLSGE